MNAEHDLDTRRRRLRFRTTHTGTRETDILLGGFVDTRVERLDEPRINELERLFATNDDRDILDWITERAPVPQEFATPAMNALIAYVRDRHQG
ncbi:MAG: succinate dehydrogenase assembly factor 2 [Alphaproteobacteria bacterium]|nr:succinate dehydrogenase assembly factor 2 [Alphaproteobacteria bacterium]